MKKIALQFILLTGLFFATWFGLSRIDWMKLFRINKATATTEKKLGDLFWELYHQEHREIKSKKIKAPLDSILNRICEANHIDTADIKLHLIENAEINAFALPDNHLVVHTGLINATENEEELAGIIGHELAHLQSRHVMKKLVKEVGLSVLISMTTGGGGSESIKELIKFLSSTAYDRTLEKEADIKAVEYLAAADIRPEPFADFLFRMGEEEGNAVQYLTWASTHPDSKERAEYIIAHSKDMKLAGQPILSDSTWQQFKSRIGEITAGTAEE